MQPANDNTPPQRPASYDAQVVAYLPFIRKLVNRGRRRVGAEDRIQEVVAELLEKWQVYDDRYKFGTWVALMARNVYLANRQMRQAKKRQVDSEGYRREYGYRSSPEQEDYAELSAVLNRLSGTRDSEALMRFAMGDELQDIGADLGVSKQRVFQLIERERGRLRVAA